MPYKCIKNTIFLAYNLAIMTYEKDKFY